MTTAERKFLIKRALLQTLADAGDYPLRENALRDHAAIKVDYLRPTTAELDALIKEIDVARLAVGIHAEQGRKWKLTDAGTLWLAENA